MKIEVTEIQRFCTHDGPGIRTTVFLKGCPLHCFWCHNPETAAHLRAPLFYESRCLGCRGCEALCPAGAHSFTEEGEHRFDRRKCLAPDCGEPCVSVCPNEALTAISRPMETGEIVAEALKDKAFYGAKGGLTVSGGEPMFQSEATLRLLREAKEAGLGTAVETCGVFDPAYLPELVSLCDHFLWDLKDTDPDRFRKNCGGDLSLILSNLRLADRLGAEIWLRGILLAGQNTTTEHYRNFADIAAGLTHCVNARFFPYHAFSGSKMLPLGFPDNGNAALIPTKEEMEKAGAYLKR